MRYIQTSRDNLSGGAIGIFTDAVSSIAEAIIGDYAEQDAKRAEWEASRARRGTGLETPPDFTEAHKHMLEGEIDKAKSTEKGLTYVAIGAGVIALITMLRN